ncbi:MAG: hypothetical protein ACLGIG_09085 [Actinomycetes bacterium]
MAAVNRKRASKVTRKRPAEPGPWTTTSGVVITDADAAAMAAAFEADDFEPGPMTKRPVGRPGLTGRSAAGPSPRVSVRVEATAYKLLRDRAAAEHRTVSDLAREAIEAFVAT